MSICRVNRQAKSFSIRLEPQRGSAAGKHSLGEKLLRLEAVNAGENYCCVAEFVVSVTAMLEAGSTSSFGCTLQLSQWKSQSVAAAVPVVGTVSNGCSPCVFAVSARKLREGLVQQ